MFSLNGTSDAAANESILAKQDRNCKAMDKSTGKLCGETESLKILSDFEKLYETRIENVDRELNGEFERVSTKLQIMKEWIKDLGDQNLMLVHIVEDLEQAACSRVRLLEEKLQQSSTIVSENIRSSNTEKDINLLSKRVSELETDEKCMQERIKFLQNDIRGLLELIRRARREDNWNLDGIQFFEIEPADILTPLDCTCRQEDTNNDQKQSLKLQVEELRANEKKLVEHQAKLKNKVTDLTTEISAKEDIIKEYNCKFQSLSNSIKSHSKLTDQLNYDSQIVDCREQEPDDVDLLNVGVSQQDKIMSYLTKTKSLMEKEKEALFSLKKEVDNLLERLRSQENSRYQHLFLESLQDMQTVFNNIKAEVYNQTPPVEMLKVYIANMAKELSNLTQSFATTFVARLEYSEEPDVLNIVCKVAEIIQFITKKYSEKENTIAVIDTIAGMQNDECFRSESPHGTSDIDMREQFKLMEAFRVSTVEAQAATEDIREEIAAVVSTFNSQYQKCIEFNKMVTEVQDHLLRTRDSLMMTLRRLQFQEEERVRQITSGKMKIKDIKNEINGAQSRLSCKINDISEAPQEQATLDYAEICICNDLLSRVTEEVEKISSSLQMSQPQGYGVTSTMTELKRLLYDTDTFIKKLQNKTDETLIEHDLTETTLNEKERKLEKLEREVDSVHTRMQELLETFLSASERIPLDNHAFNNQALREFVRTRQDLRNLRKEYDELKCKATQRTSFDGCKEQTCEWKCKLAELQDQTRTLLEEAKCKDEANDFLRNSINSLEVELCSVRENAESGRRSHSVDSMILKKKICELKNSLELQKQTESSLRQHLNESEMELKKSKELFNSFNSEYGVEGSLGRCGCDQSKHETMNIPQLLKTLQTALQSTKTGLQEFQVELKNVTLGETSSSTASMSPVASLIHKVKKYEEELENCSQDVKALKDTLYSKDILLEDKDKIISIQKDMIVMTQSELKELHQKLQEKIDTQSQVISQYQLEKSELLKQNELQVQTIGHLQNAVVDAKRCIDHLGNKTTSDVSETWSAVASPTVAHGNVHDV